jgi:hypothetical protein
MRDPRDELQEDFEKALKEGLSEPKKDRTPEQALKEALEDTTPEKPGVSKGQIRDPFQGTEEEWI